MHGQEKHKNVCYVIAKCCVRQYHKSGDGTKNLKHTENENLLTYIYVESSQ